jgi:hypothetical protein
MDGTLASSDSFKSMSFERANKNESVALVTYEMISCVLLRTQFGLSSAIKRVHVQVRAITMKDGLSLNTKLKKPHERNPSGIGGWLLFYCLYLVILSPMEFGGQLLMDLSRESHLQQMIMLLAFSVVPIVYGIIIGILLWVAWPNAVKHAKVYLIILLCLRLLGIWLSGLESRGKSPTILLLPYIEAIMSFIIWWTYFAKSTRVRNTYFQRVERKKRRKDKIVL